MTTVALTKTTVRVGKPWHVGPSAFTWQNTGNDPMSIGANTKLMFDGFTVWVSRENGEYFLNVEKMCRRTEAHPTKNVRTLEREIETSLMERDGTYTLQSVGLASEDASFIYVTYPEMKTTAA